MKSSIKTYNPKKIRALLIKNTGSEPDLKDYFWAFCSLSAGMTAMGITAATILLITTDYELNYNTGNECVANLPLNPIFILSIPAILTMAKKRSDKHKRNIKTITNKLNNNTDIKALEITALDLENLWAGKIKLDEFTGTQWAQIGQAIDNLKLNPSRINKWSTNSFIIFVISKIILMMAERLPLKNIENKTGHLVLTPLYIVTLYNVIYSNLLLMSGIPGMDAFIVIALSMSAVSQYWTIMSKQCNFLFEKAFCSEMKKLSKLYSQDDSTDTNRKTAVDLALEHSIITTHEHPYFFESRQAYYIFFQMLSLRISPPSAENRNFIYEYCNDLEQKHTAIKNNIRNLLGLDNLQAFIEGDFFNAKVIITLDFNAYSSEQKSTAIESLNQFLAEKKILDVKIAQENGDPYCHITISNNQLISALARLPKEQKPTTQAYPVTYNAKIGKIPIKNLKVKPQIVAEPQPTGTVVNRQPINDVIPITNENGLFAFSTGTQHVRLREADINKLSDQKQQGVVHLVRFFEWRPRKKCRGNGLQQIQPGERAQGKLIGSDTELRCKLKLFNGDRLLLRSERNANQDKPTLTSFDCIKPH